MLQELDINLENNQYLEIEDSENKGRCIIAKQDIPASTDLIINKPLFFFDHLLHPPSILRCETCKSFYSEEAQQELQRNFRGHVGYIHILAEVMQACEEKKQIFNKLDFCNTNYEKSENLKETKNFIEKFIGWDEKTSDIIDRLASNAHGQTEPPNCGVFMNGSMFNHSCKNNSFFFLQDNQLILRNFRPIKQGQEVTISYIRNLYQPRTFRQTELAYRGFKCQCSRCKSAQEIVRVWNCPNSQQEDKCKGDFTPKNNTATFQCNLCGLEDESFLSQAKKAEKDFDMAVLSKKHFKIHKDMDENLRQNGMALPEELYECLSLQLIQNHNRLFETDHHPENISLYDVIGQRFQHAQDEEKAKYYFDKAYVEAKQCFGENSQQAEIQKERALNPPKQCCIF